MNKPVAENKDELISNSSAKKKRLKSEKKSFWSFYYDEFLFEHQHPVNVALHVIGTLLSVIFIINLLLTALFIIPHFEEYATNWNKFDYYQISSFIKCKYLTEKIIHLCGDNEMAFIPPLDLSFLEFLVALLLYPGKESAHLCIYIFNCFYFSDCHVLFFYFV